MTVELTPEQVEIFNRRLATYGVSMEDLAGRDLNTGSGGAKTFLAGHPDAGPDHAGEVRTVPDIAAMKALGGVPDVHYTDDGIGDGHIDYPPPPPETALAAAGASGGDLCALLDTLDPDTIADSRRAMRAYLLGNSTKAAAWEPMLNALYFPLDGTVLSYDNVVVASGTTLTIPGPGPVTYNANTVTVEPNASIVCLTDVTFNVGIFDVQS